MYHTSSLGAILVLLVQHVSAMHHMKREPVHWVSPRDSNIPLVVTNNCADPLYPAIQTQAGTGPALSGFYLAPGSTSSQKASANWQGRIWARTNCSFNDDGTGPGEGISGAACTTGDCGGTVACAGSGNPPASLAEFTIMTSSGQTFYDLSLVDGYNLPIGIIRLDPNNSTNNNSGSGSGTNSNATSNVPPNFTNPICIGTSSILSSTPTSDPSFSSPQYPLPLDMSVDSNFVSSWCPWPLLTLPPAKPGDGVYPYPDDNIARPPFQPCLSACARWNLPQYCCTGSHGSPKTCSPSEYSTSAKAVCPDAYSYAFDDQTSTFIVPTVPGVGFEVVFCPSGRSTTILKTFGNQISQVASTGVVTKTINQLAMNDTFIAEQNAAVTRKGLGGSLGLSLVVSIAWLIVVLF